MKIKNVLFWGSVCILFLFGIAVSRYNVQNSQLPLLSLEEFELLLNSKNDSETYVYVGRDSCPSCSLVYPTLCDIKNESNLDICYYSTEPDRDIRPEEMHSLLDRVNVDYVPSIVVLSHGTVQSVISGEDFVNQYFAEGGQYEY